MSKEELNLDYQKAYEVFRETMREGNYLLSVKSALEKQIPKKPKILKVHDISNYKYGKCECGEHICDDENYCSKCGQALDWSDTE